MTFSLTKRRQQMESFCLPLYSDLFSTFKKNQREKRTHRAKYNIHEIGDFFLNVPVGLVYTTIEL
ncbi:CLUMA_CG005628, isoform A [Clunio marinus]|uniref:CLUMA_CG005628, isoform A n=1 Tax=Clunio marinus TaxID=568069 RepID=A0A1J1HVF6_9DIPT|nr:CLUMA_CG005628, isoform A [Clunio marinus]